ncbi:MAG: hypothetical protein IH940_05045 [Acidobacteria bacterium]|nr:hypothetical protein [Acidobacteriota bacterium]
MVPLRVCALVTAAALSIGGCSSSSDPADPATLEDPSTVVEINTFATELIRDHGVWPETVDARRLFILDQALYETWAVFDGEASGVIPDGGHRAIVAGFDPASIDVALNAAAVVVFEELFDDSVVSLAEVEKYRDGHGLSDVTPGIESPAEFGARMATLVLDEHETDGSGEDFFYRVIPTEDPDQTESDQTAWRPLPAPTGAVTDSSGRPVITEDPESNETQGFETYHWGDVATFALTDPELLYPVEPPHPPPREPGPYLDEVLSIAASASMLDDAARAEVAAWTTEHSALTWNELARSVITSSAMTGDDAIKALFTMHAAMHDTYVVAWGAKLAYLSPRPVTEVRRLTNSAETFDLFGDPIAVEEWIPYQDPRSPSPSSPSVLAEQVAAAGAAGTVLNEFLEGDLALSREIDVAEDDWMVGPGSQTTLVWSNYEEVIGAVSKATTDAGISFASEVAAGRVLGERVGPEAYRQAVKLWLVGE